MRWGSRTLIVAVLTSFMAIVPQTQSRAGQTPRLVTESVSPFDRQELLRRVDAYEQSVLNAQAAHWSPERLAMTYADLGTMYEELSMYPKSETAYRHAIALLEARPQPQLAEALKLLASLHCLMGHLSLAEQDHQRALKVRKRLGDPAAIALTWNDLADIYYRQRRFNKSVDYARKALTVLADNPKVDAANRIAVRQTLGYALCAVHNCSEATSLLKQALDIADAAYGPNSLQVGIAEYELGDAAWRNEDLDNAAQWIAAGLTHMKANMRARDPLYEDALWEYAHVLRQRGQVEEANAAEREVKMASTVVDVRTPAAGR